MHPLRFTKMKALSNTQYSVLVLLVSKQQRATFTKSVWTCVRATKTFVFMFALFLCSGAEATDTSKHQAGHNSSSDINHLPDFPSTPQDPDDMTLEEYRKASGGSLPPEYSLAAAAVGAFILILTMFIVAVLTVLRNRFCSNTRSSSVHQPDVVDMISIDQSKASTSSTSRPATIHVKKKGEKSMNSSKYQKLELKDYPEVSFETKEGKQNKRDLETQHNRRKSSTTSADSVTPREQYISTSSLPTFEA